MRADLHNNTGTAQVVQLVGSISHGDTDITFTRTARIAPRATVHMAVAPARVPGLRIRHPAVWWPYQMGAQPLYHLALEAQVAGVASDAFAEDFGIRTVTSRLTPVVPGTYGRSGYRQFAINGRPFVVRGGGWSQDLFLRYSSANVADQLAYVRDLGLNAIRFEGNLPPDDMFQQLDRAGILALPGWQCCNRWEQGSDRWSSQIVANARNQAAHVAALLRDHPSVLAFYQGSDDDPDPAKEALYLAAFRHADWRLPQIASAEYRSSRKLGPSGSKEGPYNWAPPAYWWDSGREMDVGGSFTNAGGAFGFDTEASAGITMPTRDSLDRFLTARDERGLWDVRSVGGTHSGPDIFHASPYSDYTAIGRLGQYNTALWHRYGHWSGLASYEREAQAAGYEVARAQFEAYIGHAHDRANPSTGLIYWQLNKAWPSVQWQLYGYDFDQAGVYFGAKKANESVHIMYAYSDGSIRVSNLTNTPQVGLHARVEFRRIDGGRASRAHGGGAPAAGSGRPDGAPACDPPGHVLDVLPGADAHATRRGREPQRVLALDDARPHRLVGDARQRDRRCRAPGRLRGSHGPATARARLRARRGDDDARWRGRRDRCADPRRRTFRRPCVPPACRCQARPAPRRGAPDPLERQRSDDLARRGTDVDRSLPGRGPAERSARRDRRRLERRTP